MTFRGISVVGVDDKGRVAIPSKYRNDLIKCCRGELIVTADSEGCLLIYPATEWAPIENQLLNLPSMSRQARLIQRMLIGHATECVMDKQGRLLLPSVLRKMSGVLNRQAVLLGQGKRFELWDEQKWEQSSNAWMAKAKANESDLNEVLGDIRL